jgi:hypothetical protein
MIASYKTMLPDKKILQAILYRYFSSLGIELEKKNPNNFQPQLLSAPGETDSANALLLTKDTFVSLG